MGDICRAHLNKIPFSLKGCAKKKKKADTENLQKQADTEIIFPADYQLGILLHLGASVLML